MSAPTAPRNRNAIPEPEHILLQARNVEFDWSNLPMHWIPGDPFSTHVLNVLHLLLPAGEEWFVETFKEALPLIEDEQLRDDVVGFIGQEAMHSNAHTGVLVHLKEKGLDPTPFTEQMEWTFSKILGPRPLTGLREKNYLIERLAVIAAIEHITAFLGDWVLNADGLDRAGMHPTMLDLLRWHGAEEVEHRSVAYDVMRYFDKRESRRIRTQVIVTPVIVWLWVRGTRFLMRNDPELAQWSAHRRKPHLTDFFAAGKRGTLPTARELAKRMSTYFTRTYHPSNEGSTAQAVKYLASSPAAQAAER
ncbi:MULTISPECIES: metal-dependent hydrolase [unclassified Rhodococcus (in: high G+C Gram-positive bacteria)]|uniref:metal-dependent hydrolase n=1 Tax=unclassified Rhodococcus (in: high G+C Gram-positive bacteria) TaxID=192944 RepID=UPI001639E02D|nr:MULTISPECIES: metal-dependent hydrolase [unclassified Rhodococcus (in: high G+C Gram-positive bacteria)]MBC2641084.1 metal-dependent hydrolase [Rhodococcus sp. 3A]MBC2894171.1 metal-dependent hydrolase [Rhodococcus sp. 4CII]